MTVARIHFFLTSLLFTVTVETAVIFFLLRYVFKDTKTSNAKIILSGAFASFATIPYVWFVFPYITKWSADVAIIWSESFVFVVETIFYRIIFGTSILRSITLSLVANACSFFLSRFLRAAHIWIYW